MLLSAHPFITEEAICSISGYMVHSTVRLGPTPLLLLLFVICFVRNDQDPTTYSILAVVPARRIIFRDVKLLKNILQGDGPNKNVLGWDSLKSEGRVETRKGFTVGRKG
uniref:Uncharacterized protein n=1 Tax=Solanum lycopersicum TaxID=4081 RepID=A0A3Q7FQ42_SOLLC